MFAAQNGHTETVQALLAAGVEVNAKNNRGDTALILPPKKSTLKRFRYSLPLALRSMLKMTKE